MTPLLVGGGGGKVVATESGTRLNHPLAPSLIRRGITGRRSVLDG
jgi:hypothetical protein